jgi:hypothetical protein
MRFITKKHLSRRALLRGGGTCLALPLLDAMWPAATALAQSPAAPRTRLGCIYIPHGATMAKWTPSTTGRDFAFSEILAPLEGLRRSVNVISNLTHPQAYGPGGATAHHNRSSAVFLSGAMAQAGAHAQLGVTLDQVVAQSIGQDTPLPSLELMIESGSLSCGDGLSCAYRNTISWQSPTAPLPMQNNPQVVFERLFGDGSTQEERQARRIQSQSLLDSVAEQIATLERTLPAEDRSRLDMFLTDVREIERRIARAGQQVSDDLDVPTRPSGIPDDVEEHIKLMMDLQVLAWQADITRVSTLLMGMELTNTVYPNSGIRESFHILSHHSNLQESKDRFAILNRYHVGLFADLLIKLDSLPDGDGSLLDHSMLLYGSGMSDGNEHNHSPLPVLLAGGASGRLAGNRHIEVTPDTSMSNLLLAMLLKLGVQRDSFGDSTEAVDI